MLISRLSKAQYVIFLGTTFQSHSTSSAIKRLGENQTFWITALGWCQSSFYLIYRQLGQHLSPLIHCIASVNNKPFSSCCLDAVMWNVKQELKRVRNLLRFTEIYSAAKLVFCGFYEIMWNSVMLAIDFNCVSTYLETIALVVTIVFLIQISVLKIFVGKRVQLLSRFQTVWEEIKWLKLFFERHDLFLIIQIAWDTVYLD